MALVLPGTADAARSISTDPRYAAIVIDANTGKVLFSRSADSLRYPASLTKMMTLYMLFDALQAGRITKSSRVRFSRRAAAMPPSKLGIRAGRSISVEQAILALVTKSANDVAAAVAERLSGSEAKFATAMTARARALGMSRTTFKNASGLPNSAQRTTARDMATLAKALQRDFPQYYRYFSTRSFAYGGRRFPNHNRLLGNYPGVDGIKTGYTRASGFNLTTSVRYRDKYVIAVVMGGPTGRERNAHMRALLDRYVPRAVAMRNVPQRVEVNVAAMPMPPSRPSLVAMALPPQPTPAQSNAPKPTPAPLAVASAVPPSLAPGTHESEELTSMTALVVASVTPTSPPSEPVSLEGAASVFEGAGSIADDTRRELAERLQSERWLIQIGAYNNETAARQRLAAALQSANTHLAPRLAYTEPVETSSRTLFRARFAGFDQDSAQAACAQLKRADFTCISMKQ